MEKETDVAAVAVHFCFLRNVVVGDHVPAPLLAAHVGPPKGVDLEWVSEQLVRDSLVGGSQGNGFIERGVIIEERVQHRMSHRANPIYAGRASEA